MDRDYWKERHRTRKNDPITDRDDPVMQEFIRAENLRNWKFPGQDWHWSLKAVIWIFIFLLLKMVIRYIRS